MTALPVYATPAERDAAVEAIMTHTSQQARHALHDQRKRQARIVLRRLHDGTAYDPLAFPAGMADLVWSLPQDIVVALARVGTMLCQERLTAKRHRAGAFTKPNPFRIHQLIIIQTALRWLRRNEWQAWAEMEAAE